MKRVVMRAKVAGTKRKYFEAGEDRRWYKSNKDRAIALL